MRRVVAGSVPRRALHGSRAVRRSWEEEEGPLRAASLDTASYPPSKVNTVFNVVPQGFAMVTERLGRFQAIQEPGWFLAVPIVDRIAAVHDLRELCLQVSKQQATTRDNVRLSLEGNVYVRVADVYKATYNIRNPLHAILLHAEAAMRASVGLFELDNIFHARAELNSAVLGHLKEACAKWGLEVTRYEVTGVDADAKIAESMDLQAAAERRRRETVKTAEAEKEAIILESEAQRERDLNEGEGRRLRTITEAKGYQEEQILKAEGQRQAKILEADATAYALDKIGRAVATPEGRQAMAYLFGVEYTKYMSEIGSKSNSTIFLGQDLGDIGNVLTKGLGILGTNAFQNDKKGSTSGGGKGASSSSSSSSGVPNAPGDRYDDYPLPTSPFMAQSGLGGDSSGGKYSREIDELNQELSQFGPVERRD